MQLNYVEALAAYRAALEKNPRDVVLHYNIGRAQQARGDYPGALDALLEFEKKAPPETKAKVPQLAQLIGDVRGRVGQLDVKCSLSVPESTIVIDTTHVEGCTTTPKRVRVSLPSRTATVEVRLESEQYRAPNVRVSVEGGGAPVDVLLVPAPKATSGILRVEATPDSAVVLVDGTLKGNSPVEVSLPPGSHVVDVNAESYESTRVPFVMESGGRKELKVTLQKSTPVMERWWFWPAVGGGVVAVAAITVTVILIVQPEREHTRGTIEPGVVSAPLVTF